jgi:hypothetical protein
MLNSVKLSLNWLIDAGKQNQNQETILRQESLGRPGGPPGAPLPANVAAQKSPWRMWWPLAADHPGDGHQTGAVIRRG